MKNVQEKVYPKGGRAKLHGWFRSSDGLVESLGSGVVENYEKICSEDKRKTEEWVERLRSLGVKAAHPDDGWHERGEYRFGLAYAYFNDGIEVGDMVALGDYEKFVVVIVNKISGFLSKRYHYQNSVFPKL